MTPTVCLSELPMGREATNSHYCHRRRRQRVRNGAVDKHRRLMARRFDKTDNWQPSCLARGPTCSTVLAGPQSAQSEQSAQPPQSPQSPQSLQSPNGASKILTEPDYRWRLLLARREGLLGIVVRTMALVRRNDVLQQRVNALRAETREFIRSVLNNPENMRPRQDRLDAIVSSSSEKTAPLASLPEPTNSPLNIVTSTCCMSDWDSDESQASNCSV